MLPRVAIIYLSYHSDQYLDDVVSAFKNLTYPKDRVEFVIVDNLHSEYGLSTDVVEEKILPLSGTEIPHVTYLPQKENLGFAGGNNVGIKWALEHDFDYIYLHNDDGFMASDSLWPLVKIMEDKKDVAIVQPLILLYPDTEYINNTGNAFHYLGFGFCNQYRQKVEDINLQETKEIAYVSGAACLIRSSLLKEFGLLDQDFFMYHEDMEITFRFRLLGYKTMLATNSIFYHKYQFSRSIEKFYFMERNRYAVMLLFFRWPTLILLLPMAIILEIGLWLFAWRGGWLNKKKKVYAYWLNKNNRKFWLAKRKKIQNLREVTDRYLLSYSVSEIYFQEKEMETWVLKYIGNPVMKVYYNFVNLLIFW